MKLSRVKDNVYCDKIDEPVCMVLSAGGETKCYYHYDGLGSVRQLTSGRGGLSAYYSYDSFGNVIAAYSVPGSVANTYGFTGEQQFDEADNLVFLRARYYDSRVGRFISRDPILSMDHYTTWGGFAPKLSEWYTRVDPRLLNAYLYCFNNPVNSTDPSGTICCDGAGLLECLLKPLINQNNRNILSYCIMACTYCANVPSPSNPFCIACGGCGVLGAIHVGVCIYHNCSL